VNNSDWLEQLRRIALHTEYPPSSWLKTRMTPEDEQAILNNPAFANFVERWQEGDELWEFSSPLEEWRFFAGRAGIALVRDGRSIACVVTRLN
jgi:hypothetical protein